MVLTRAIFEEITWSDMRKILQERTHIYYFHSGDVLKEELKNKKIKEHEVTCSFILSFILLCLRFRETVQRSYIWDAPSPG